MSEVKNYNNCKYSERGSCQPWRPDANGNKLICPCGDWLADYSTLNGENIDLKFQLSAANEQIGRLREKLDKARELFEDYHLAWCSSAECGECTIDDCALRELGLLLYGYESECIRDDCPVKLAEAKCVHYNCPEAQRQLKEENK